MSQSSSEHMTLTLFGPLELRRDGQTVRLRRRKSLAMLAYLAMAERPQTRSRLASLLWPESDTQHALGSLRLAIHEINQTTNLLTVTGDLVSLDPAACSVDARRFRDISVQRAETEELEGAVDLYRDDFLRGFALKDAQGFDDWAFFTAESLQTRLGSVLRELVERSTREDTTRAIHFAEQLVQHEPLDEDNHRSLIELYVTEGRYSAAIRQYEKCRELLARELQEEPSGDLVELYESLKGKAGRIEEPSHVGSGYLKRTILALATISDAFTSASQDVRRALGRASYSALSLAVLLTGIGLGLWEARRPPEIPTVVVTPFSYAYVGRNQEPRGPVAATLTRFVENELIDGSGLNVRSAREAPGPETGTDELIRICRQENADYVLHGAVLDDGNQYSVTVRLVDRWTREILMGHDFLATNKDLVIELRVLTDMASEAVYRQLGSEMTDYLTSGEALLNPYCETATLLMGYHMSRDHTEAERAQLYSIIKENLIADPYLREGYFVQSDWYWVAGIYGVMPPVAAGELLRTALENAGADEHTPQYYVTRGIYSMMYEGAVDSAATDFSRAYQQETYSVASARWYALALAISGRLELASDVLASTERYAPADPSLRLYMSTFNYLSGKYQEAIDIADESISRNDRWIGLMQKGQALLAMGRTEEAAVVLEESVAMQDSMQAPRAYLAIAYARLGRTNDARSIRASMRFQPSDDPAGFHSPAMEAVVSLALGDDDRAREELARAAREYDPMLWLLAHDPVVEADRELIARFVSAPRVALVPGE